MCKRVIDDVVSAHELLKDALIAAQKQAFTKTMEYGPGNKYGNVRVSLTAATNSLAKVEEFIAEAKRNNS